MGAVDYIIIFVVVLILGAAGLYVYKAKKSGKKCIGCPDGGTSCAGSCSSCCGCNSGNT